MQTRRENGGIGLAWLRVWGTVIVVSVLTLITLWEKQGDAYWVQRWSQIWSVPAVTLALAFFINTAGHTRGLLSSVGGWVLGLMGLLITTVCCLVLTVAAASEAKQAGLPVPDWAEAIETPPQT